MPYGMRPAGAPAPLDVFLYEAVLLPEAAAMCARWLGVAVRPPATSGPGLWSAACKGFFPAAGTEYKKE